MRSLPFLVCLGFAASFVGADCSTPTGLTRTCSGSAVTNLWFHVISGCGGSSGTVEISVPTAGQCTVTVVEPTAVGLPTTGTFNETAGATGYVLAKGGWTLEPPPTGMMQETGGSSLQCTAGAPTAAGDISLTCNITTCSQTGDDDEYTCSITGMCDMQLSPAPASSPITVTGVDAAAPAMDAGHDGGTKDGSEDAPKTATGG